MEDFVIRELAVKLKEKGFNWNCVSFYPLESFTGEYVDSCGDCYEVDFEKDELYLNYPLHYKKHETKCLPAPTISQVLKWLRKEKDIHIEIFLYNRTYSYFIKSITKISEDDYFHQCLNEDTVDMEYETHELAALAGIEYVLDNLI